MLNLNAIKARLPRAQGFYSNEVVWFFFTLQGSFATIMTHFLYTVYIESPSFIVTVSIQ